VEGPIEWNAFPTPKRTTRSLNLQVLVAWVLFKVTHKLELYSQQVLVAVWGLVRSLNGFLLGCRRGKWVCIEVVPTEVIPNT